MLKVWVAMIGTTLAMLIYLRLTSAAMFRPLRLRMFGDIQQDIPVKNGDGIHDSVVSFVLGNLVSQGIEKDFLSHMKIFQLFLI